MNITIDIINKPKLKRYLLGRDNGQKEWYLNDRRHREDGPAWEFEDGTKMWFINGRRHRIDGPAIEWASGSKVWYLDGKRHRDDGPAIIHFDGSKEWWIDGIRILEKNHPFIKALKRYRLYSKWKRNELTEDESVLIRCSL